MSNTSLMNKHIFEENLIKEIRNHPCLYNKKVSEYKDKSSRDNAWKEVAEAVEQSEKICKLRWKSLRDRYVREVNETKPSGSYWHFYDLLSFLHDHIVSKRKRDSKIRIKNEKINNDDSNDNTLEFINDPMYEECTVDPLPNFNDNNYINENIDDYDEEIDENKTLSQTPQVIIPIYQDTNQTSSSFSSSLRVAKVKRKSQRLNKDNLSHKKKFKNNDNQIIVSNIDDIQEQQQHQHQQKQQNNDDDENKILKFLDKFNEIIDKRLTETTITKDNIAKQHRPFFKMLENYLDKIDERQHDDFKLEILNYVNERCREYYN